MVTDYKQIMKQLYDEFSSRFCALDIYRVYDIPLSSDINFAFLLLQVKTNTKENILFLRDNNYHTLVANILMYCQFTQYHIDACTPFVDKQSFENFSIAFNWAQEHLSYVWGDDGLYFQAPEFFIDIVRFPLSQFHSEIINALDTFKPFIDMGFDVFLNAQSPSFFTQFSQFWVAECLGITDNNPKNIGVE